MYCIYWNTKGFNKHQKKTPIIAPILFTFDYDPQMDSFQIKDKDMIFTKKDNVKEELLYEYKVPDILVGTWSDKDHSNSFTINDQTITVYDYDAGIDNITYDITGFDCLPLDSKGKLIDYKGKILLYRVFWDINAFRERYPDTDSSTSFFVFYYDLETQSLRTKDENNYFTKD